MARLVLVFLAISCVVSAVLAGPAHAPRREIHDSIMHIRATTNETVHPNNDGHGGKLTKRFSNARFTNYKAGQGACGGTNSDSDFIVALNANQYGSGENCYKMITISYNGKSTQAQIVDECPGCPDLALDLTPGLFSYFADLGLGEIYGSWSFVDDTATSTSSSSTKWTTSSSTPAWTPTTTSTPTYTSTSSEWTTSLSSSSSSTWSSSSSSSSWSSSSSTWSSSTRWSSTSSSSSTSSAPVATPTSSVTPENGLIDALDYSIMQIGDLFAGAAQANLQTADS